MTWKSLLMVGAMGVAVATPAAANITFYEREGFRGQALTTSRSMRDLHRFAYNGGALSAVVDSGRWEVCEDRDFGGRCVILRRGSYDSLGSMGIGEPIASVRTAAPHDDRGYPAPPPPMEMPDYQYRQRPHERTYEVPIIWAHAVVGPPDQRCWVERERVTEHGHSAAGAVAGAILGGILGHQLGGDHHEGAATAGGAVAGAAIGATVGHGHDHAYDRDVRRCEDVPSGPPDYWEVAYDFHGVQHVVQMTEPPESGRIFVNRDGEPRQ